MFELTESQKNAVHEFERNSYERFCKLHGLDPVEYEARLLQLLRRRMSERGLDIDAMPESETKAEIVRILSMDNYFEIRAAEEDIRRNQYAEMIAKHSGCVPINYAYIGDVARKHGMPVPIPGDAQSLQHFLAAVPIVINWGPAFNAFLTRTGLFEDLPCIFVHETLLTAVDAFQWCIAPVIIDTRGEPWSLLSEWYTKLGIANPDYVEMLRSCLDFALCKINHAYLPNIQDPRFARTINFMVNGCGEAVWFHEFGHLLLGHLGQKRGHNLEFEADRFAFTLLDSKKDDHMAERWKLLGAITALVLIDALGRIKGTTEGQSHPSGRRRVFAALDTLNAANSDAYAVTRGYVSAIATACGPTIKAIWNVDFEYEELTASTRRNKYGSGSGQTSVF